MRVNPINTKTTYSNGHKIKARNLHRNQQNDTPVFQGVKGGIKGGAVGAAAALTLAALAGPFGLAVLPLWTTAGAIGGHTMEEENKPSDNENKKQ